MLTKETSQVNFKWKLLICSVGVFLTWLCSVNTWAAIKTKVRRRKKCKVLRKLKFVDIRPEIYLYIQTNTVRMRLVEMIWKYDSVVSCLLWHHSNIMPSKSLDYTLLELKSPKYWIPLNWFVELANHKSVDEINLFQSNST